MAETTSIIIKFRRNEAESILRGRLAEDVWSDMVLYPEVFTLETFRKYLEGSPIDADDLAGTIFAASCVKRQDDFGQNE